MKQEKKSPITLKPLRYAGQSLDEKIDQLLNDKMLPYIISGMFLILMTGMEWLRYYTTSPPTPKTTTFIAACYFAYAFYKIKKIRYEVKSLRIGRDGEKEVGELLDELREKGYKVLHDIPGENFNIDHVIISKKGIYTIETKTYSVPLKGKAEMWYDGEKITIPNRIKSDAPIIQAAAASKWLCNTLQTTTGKEFTIKPVVLFPGWFLNHTDNAKKAKVWVLHPKAVHPQNLWVTSGSGKSPSV